MTDLCAWFRGLSDMGCTFLKLVPNGKYSARPWYQYSTQTGERGLASALGWLRRYSLNMSIVDTFIHLAKRILKVS